MSFAIFLELESESIEIIREVAATATKPVMLYSIGKDSSVMLRLAQKAFFPGPIPFPLMHIDTGWKFREMIAFSQSDGAGNPLRADHVHEPARRFPGDWADHPRLGLPHRCHED
jgi:sulfate adenylyltransferase subunit 2